MTPSSGEIALISRLSPGTRTAWWWLEFTCADNLFSAESKPASLEPGETQTEWASSTLRPGLWSTEVLRSWTSEPLRQTFNVCAP